MNITISNSNDPIYEEKLDNLIQDVFGVSFAPWFARKLWDQRYESYSIIQNGKMLSNVCIYKTDMLVQGKPVHANQFGGVATRKEQRGKGFSRLLMEHILSLYPNTPAFLSGDPGVIDFYLRFGFRQVQTYCPQIAVKLNNPTDRVIKCKPDDDIVGKALSGKRIYSNLIDSVNTQPVQKFNMLLEHADNIYFLPDCGAVVIAEQENNKLFLADVISQKQVTFDQLKRELPFTGVEIIEFGFCPDWLDINPSWKPVDGKQEPFFLRGTWNLPERFRFPIMSET